MPESLLQNSIKVANEVPADMRSNLRRAWANFSQEWIDECAKDVNLKGCLFTLCFYHALVGGMLYLGCVLCLCCCYLCCVCTFVVTCVVFTCVVFTCVVCCYLFLCVVTLLCVVTCSCVPHSMLLTLFFSFSSFFSSFPINVCPSLCFRCKEDDGLGSRVGVKNIPSTSVI